jgi:hypothetical protein
MVTSFSVSARSASRGFALGAPALVLALVLANAAGCALGGGVAPPIDEVAPPPDGGAHDATLDVAQDVDADALHDAPTTNLDQGLPPLEGDDGGDDADSAPPPDAGDDAPDVPTSAQLVDPNGRLVDGVTNDGWVVFEWDDSVSHVVQARPLAAGNAVTICRDGAGFAVKAFAEGAMCWHACDDFGRCTLSIWTPQTGVHDATLVAGRGMGAIAADGSAILFVANVNANGTVGAIYGDTATGSAPKSLVASFGIGAQTASGPGLAGTCTPHLGFVGHTAVLAYCQPGEELAAIELATAPFAAAPRPLTDHTSPAWSTDPAQHLVLYAGNGHAGLFDVTTNAPPAAAEAAVDAFNANGDVSGGGLSPSGRYVILASSSGTLARIGVVSGSFEARAVSRVLGFSDDDVFFETRSLTDGSASSNLFDARWLADGGNSEVVLTTQTSGVLLGPSRDQTYVYYRVGDFGLGAGDLYALALDGGAPSDLLANVAALVPAAGARAIAVADFDSLNGLGGVGTLYLVDPAKGSARLLARSGSSPAVTHDGLTAVFVYVGDAADDGIYAYALP